MSSYQPAQSWLLDLILTIMRVCLFLVLAPILWSPTPSSSHLLSLTQSLPNWFSPGEKSVNISLFVQMMWGKVSWLTPIPPRLYTWDTDYNDNIIADILHNVQTTFIQSQLGIQNKSLPSEDLEWLGETAWDCQLSQWVKLVKYFNKESYVTVENVSQYVKWNIFNGLHSPIPSYLSAPPDIKISKNISFYISCLSVFINIKSDIFSFFYNLQ